jgi:hypothetical protein
MPAEEDFLTNVEAAFLAIFTANDVLKDYHWQAYDSDEQIVLPRGVLVVSARRDPDETPYYRIEVAIRLEGRPKHQDLSPVRNELVDVFEQLTTDQLSTASEGTVAFIGKGINVVEDSPIREGLRTRTLNFVIYGVATS